MNTKKKDIPGGEEKDIQDGVLKRPTCFVIMPIADMLGYDPGHFGRVYEYLLKPAIESAGYIPVRADDTSKTDYIVVGIIQKIVESEMVVCDLSARNANVMYELGIRHAFNKPVVLIKDSRTEKVFDIQGLRYTLYDETLRVDSVEKDISKIGQSIKETAASEERDLNSIVKLAGIHAAEAPRRTEVSSETQLILNALHSIEARVSNIESIKSPQYFISPSPPASQAQARGVPFRLGDIVENQNLDIKGRVTRLNSAAKSFRVTTEDGGSVSFQLTPEQASEWRLIRSFEG